MVTKEIERFWNRNFPNFSPVPSELKNHFKNRWLRIHSLPKSKRYPENENEYAVILKRHNVILSDLFGAQHQYFLITGSYGYESEKLLKDKELTKLNLQNNFWRSVQTDEFNNEPIYLHAYFDEKFWEENLLNDLFRLVIDEKAANVMLFSAGKNFVYHPYDGGADIIFKTSELRDIYKEKYKDWLSKHPLGM